MEKNSKIFIGVDLRAKSSNKILKINELNKNLLRVLKFKNPSFHR